MRNNYPPERLSLVVALSLLLVGCQQSDQELPFELAPGEGVTVQIGPSGGTVSLPPSFSMEIPANALASATSVDVIRRISGPFPSDAGAVVPGTAFDVDPAGTPLGSPATVQIKVDPTLLEAGDDVRLSVAVLRGDGSVATFQGTYDVTNELLIADVDELGPVAAVVSLDAIAVTAGLAPELPGGSFPTPPVLPGPVGPAATSHGGVAFAANCAPDSRQCFSSGLIRLWADDVVRQRMGDDLWLLDPTVSAELEFLEYDLNGVPTQVVGSLSVSGDLRARFNSTVSTYDLAEGSTTGPTTSAFPTTLRVQGNVMIVGQTTSTSGEVVESDFDEEVEFGITGIGTSEMLIIRVESELEFENSDGTFEYGYVIAHVRLRR